MPKRETQPLNDASYVSVNDEAKAPTTASPKTWARRILGVTLVTGMVSAAIVVAILLSRREHDGKGGASPGPSPVLIPGCDHPIYCTGPLLEAVQSSNLFPDDKTFVDMPIVNISSPDALLQEFLRVQPSLVIKNSSTIPTYNTTLLMQFVNQYFAEAGSDVVSTTPSDWSAAPPSLNSSSIKFPKTKAFGLSVNEAWKVLVRTYSNRSAYCDGCLSSISLPHPFVVPGGRFREFYYWDSYWILNGLLISGMNITARNTLRNFFALVDDYGFIPNGARIYFLDRSQPPLLAEMVNLFYTITGDTSIISEAMPRLLREHRFWMETAHLINTSDFSNAAKARFSNASLETALLNRYFSSTKQPRPESWREDVATSALAPNRNRDDLFSNLAAGAETGWDYSSRWLNNSDNAFYPPQGGISPQNNPNYNNLSTILVRHIIPVDLNSILLRSEEIIASYLFGNWSDQTPEEKALFTPANGVVFDPVLAAQQPGVADRTVCLQYAQYAQRRRNSIQTFLYLNNRYSDFNMNAGVYTAETNAATGFAPFYASSVLPYSIETISRYLLTEAQISAFIADSEHFIDVGGIAASNISVNFTTGNPQQWDYPNGWAPLQYWAVNALSLLVTVITDRFPNSVDANAAAYSKRLVINNWMTNNYCGYQRPQTLPDGQVVHSLVEKYAVNQDAGLSGHGGEYTVQVGFGWTNGVALNFIATNGDWLDLGVAGC